MAQCGLWCCKCNRRGNVRLEKSWRGADRSTKCVFPARPKPSAAPLPLLASSCLGPVAASARPSLQARASAERQFRRTHGGCALGHNNVDVRCGCKAAVRYAQRCSPPPCFFRLSKKLYVSDTPISANCWSDGMLAMYATRTRASRKSATVHSGGDVSQQDNPATTRTHR